MHCVGAAVIGAKATPDQQERYLNPINQGKHITTLALSEPGTGSHFYFPQTTLTPLSDTTFQVNGKKSFITNLRLRLIRMSSPPLPPVLRPRWGEFSCAMVPEGSEGLIENPLARLRHAGQFVTHR